MEETAGESSTNMLLPKKSLEKKGATDRSSL